VTDKTVTVRLEAVTNGYQANMTAAAGTTKALETQVKATTAAVQGASPATAAWGNDLNKIGGILNRTVTPAALAAVVAIKSFQDGQDSLRTETGATGAQLDGLSESMVNVGNQVPTSLGKIGQVMGDLNVRTGQTGPGLERLTKQLVDLDRIKGLAERVTRTFCQRCRTEARSLDERVRAVANESFSWLSFHRSFSFCASVGASFSRCSKISSTQSTPILCASIVDSSTNSTSAASCSKSPFPRSASVNSEASRCK
jgi:hypothetical protein